MSADAEVPTFSECVLGYREWTVDEDDRLWPLHRARRPWAPGVNVARCNSGAPNELRFVWSSFDHKHALEPAPRHEAPDADCDCGLYSWRRPLSHWARESLKPGHVAGAIASWGRLEVHATGFRAQFACIVTLALAPDVADEDRRRFARIASRYRVDLVALDDLQEAASRHGTPLPEWLTPE